MQTYKSKPEQWASFLLGHEGEGSLLNYLREKLWADDLVAGVGGDGLDSNSLFSIFNISVHLTENGFNYIDQVSRCSRYIHDTYFMIFTFFSLFKQVIEAVFSYLRFLKQNGPSERIFKEIQMIQQNSFDFAEESDPIDNVEELASRMRIYPAKHTISGECLYFEYDSDAIQRIIDYLNTDKFNIIISSRRLYDDQVVFNLKEEWFGTEYCERDMPEKWMALWNNVKPYTDFHLPEPNPFIADDFTLLYDNSTVLPKYPVKILENDICELWHRQDDKFLLPHACYYFYFISPIAKSTTKK